jgi:hypothetical protein
MCQYCYCFTNNYSKRYYTPTIGAAGANATIDCPATPNFTAPTVSDACGATTLTFADVTAAG